ncbi:hypothetical protein [Streptoalloteichus hindustanus]|uniref:Preprotein translocase subunit SecB n=1 Tax=Streptoalloteichus hindustanus TaxID=2017 RepID=A0A1M5IYR2_STRHI|nr:hypothetical protein [Streptoalloteichus hindustanus]SHG32893.1 hypothetical protein SAMN05444320_10841 [Streptoalloteichus hindustanus]
MARQVRSLEELLSLAEVEDVQFYEVHGRVLEGLDPVESGGYDDGLTEQPHATSRVLLQDDSLGFRLRLTVRSPLAEYVSDAAVLFRLAEPVSDIDPDIVGAFIQREAFPVLYPFVRQSIFDLASRMGVESVVLSLARLGETNFTLNLAAEDSGRVDNAD